MGIGERNDGMRGMLGTRGIRVRTRGIKGGMQRKGVGMRGIRAGNAGN